MGLQVSGLFRLALGALLLLPREANATAHPPVVGLSVSISKWHHIAMIYDGEQLHFYIDGVHASASADTGPILTRHVIFPPNGLSTRRALALPPPRGGEMVLCLGSCAPAPGSRANGTIHLEGPLDNHFDS